MKGLLIKDFKLLKGQKNFFMAITAISIIMIIVSPGTSFPIGLLGFVGALFSLSSISYDEFDNGNAFLFSLPITRKDYVLEKYIFGLISGIMFLLLGTVISLVAIGITKTGSFNEIFFNSRFFISYYFIDFINHASSYLEIWWRKRKNCYHRCNGTYICYRTASYKNYWIFRNRFIWLNK